MNRWHSLVMCADGRSWRAWLNGKPVPVDQRGRLLAQHLADTTPARSRDARTDRTWLWSTVVMAVVIGLLFAFGGRC